MINTNQGKFSIIIASWNRKEIFKEVLLKLYIQTYKNFEVIIVDNASSDGTAQMIERSYPDVKLVRLTRNVGYEAYNIGLTHTEGEYIIFMDNDAFLREDVLERLIRKFNNEPDVDVVAMNVMIYGTDISETEGWQMDTPNFHGAAVAIRKEVLDKVGGYDKDYFIVHTDLELATRILNNGYKLVYDKEIICYHLRSKYARSKVTSIFYSTRNALLYYWRYYPLFYALRLSGREVIYGFIRGSRERCLSSYFAGLLKGILAIPKMLSNRLPLKRDVYLRMRRYLDLQFREPLIKKLFSKFINKRKLFSNCYCL